MTEAQQAFIEAIKEDLARSSTFERVGFDEGEVPSEEELRSLTEKTCRAIGECLPEGELREVLIGRVRLAADQALLELRLRTNVNNSSGSRAATNHASLDNVDQPSYQMPETQEPQTAWQIPPVPDWSDPSSWETTEEGRKPTRFPIWKFPLNTSEEKREKPKRVSWIETILWGVGAAASWNYLPWLFAVVPAHFEMSWQLDFMYMGRVVSMLVVAQAVRKLLNRLGVAQRFEAGIQNNWNKHLLRSFVGTAAVGLGNGLLYGATIYAVLGDFFNIPTPERWQTLYLSSSLEDFFIYAAPVYVGLNTVVSSFRARMPADERKWFWPDRVRRLVGYVGFSILAWHILNCMIQDIISYNTAWDNLYRAMAGWVAGGFALWLTWRFYQWRYKQSGHAPAQED